MKKGYTVNSDPFELQADTVAERVLDKNENSAASFFSPKPNNLTSPQKEQLASTTKDWNSPLVKQTLESQGIPIDKSTRSFMEERLGHDFERVQIHDDSLAHQSATDVNARAYTSKNHIVFGAGQYRPNENSGKKLLAHELMHTIQQSSLPTGKIQRTPDDPDPKQYTYEGYVREGKYCRDTEVTGQFHKGQCYREIPSIEGYPSAHQYCFDKQTGEYLEPSPDHVSAVITPLADGSCAPYMGINPLIYLGTHRGRRALGHAVGDICGESPGLCGQVFGTLSGVIAGVGLPKHGLDTPGLNSILIPGIIGSLSGWLFSRGIPVVDRFVRKRGFLPTYSLGIGTDLNLSTGLGYEQRGEGFLSPLKTHITFGLDSTIDADVLSDPRVESTVIAKLGLRFDPGEQGGLYGLGSVGLGVNFDDQIAKITSSEVGIAYRFTDFLDAQVVRVQTSGENGVDYFLKLHLVAPKRVLHGHTEIP